jgi:sugar/nucleoside kinase (ribokinase family)
MEGLDYSRIGSIFVCGIEVEDPSGGEIADFVCKHPGPELFFAPGPRIMHIVRDRMEKLLARGPLLHLNETEACAYAGSLAADSGAAVVSGTGPVLGVEEAAEILAARTGNAVVITLGSRGCYYREGSKAARAGAGGNPPACGFVPPFPAAARNTVGAGDAHCGALIASLKQGKTLEEACVIANRAGAAVVAVHTISRAEYS